MPLWPPAGRETRRAAALYSQPEPSSRFRYRPDRRAAWIRWERQFGLTAKDLLDALWRCAFPARPSEQEAAASVAARSGPDVVKVERVVIDELDAEIALLFHRRHGQYERLGTQVCADKGVNRVRF